MAITVENVLRRAYLPALRDAGLLPRVIARQADAFGDEWKDEERSEQTVAGEE